MKHKKRIVPIANVVRKLGKYIWERMKDNPDIKILKYISPFSGKKYTANP